MSHCPTPSSGALLQLARLLRQTLPILALALLATGLWSAVGSRPAAAVFQCGNQKDVCECGGNNPYPCCDNGSNCTWWAWEAACCNWKVALPGWGNANTWASYASKNGNFQVLGSPIPGSIGVSTKGQYGHVVWVESVQGNKVHVSEMNCCGSCPYGMRKWSYDKSYFNGGYVVKKGMGGPVCGNSKCEGGEHCGNCPADCGSCCGNGQCTGGEDCGSCPKDCGACCGNGKCAGGETCANCPGDCGKCCGNSACDNGETCATCAKDCVCLPQGQLEAATCSSVRGWAKDPDTAKPVEVTLREGAAKLAKSTADLPHTTHPGQGFWWSTPPALKDSKPHAVEVHAQDDGHPAHAVLGPSSLICRNGPVESASWQTKEVDQAGLVVELPEGESWSLRHRHPPGYAYPLAGKVQSCLTPLPDGFDEGYAPLLWALGPTPFATSVAVDGQQLGNWTGTGEVRVEWGMGKTICLQTQALQEVPVPTETAVSFGPVMVRQGLWWWAGQPKATGWLPAALPPDGVQILATGNLAGGVRAYRALQQPFDTLLWTSDTNELPDGVHLTLRTGVAELAADLPGSHSASGLWGQEVAIQLQASGAAVGKPAPAGMKAAVKNLRAVQTFGHAEGPWMVQHLLSYGLTAEVLVPTEPAPGLALSMRHQDAGWWTTGATEASARITLAPVDRLRVLLKGALPPEIRAELRVSGQLAWSSADLPEGTGLPLSLDVELPRTSTDATVAWRLTAPADQWQAPAAALHLSGMRWLAGGWWTVPSHDLRGWRDRRTADQGVRIEAGALVVGGGLAVERNLPWAAKAVRLRYRQDLRPVESVARLLVGSKIVQEFKQIGPAEQLVELTGPVVRLALEVQAQADQVGLADALTPTETESPRWVQIDQIEVQDNKGIWHPLADLPDPSSGVEVADASGGSPAPSTSSPDSDGGCSSSSRPGLNGWAGLALLALCVGWTRSRGRAPGRCRSPGLRA